jgi:glycosyltransferase involved in cell wall biosynthesis
LRILHVDPERAWGGGEEQVFGLVRHLNAGGHRVAVAADPGGRLWEVARAAGVDLCPLRVRNGFDAGAAARLRRFARERDVVHLHTARAHALCLLLGSGGGRRVVTRRMDYRPRPAPYARLLYNRCVDHVVAISTAIRDVLLASGVEAGRISVIPSGVDVDRFAAAHADREAVRAEWMVEPQEPVVVAVGALVRRKGHAVLLEAARRLAAQRIRARYVLCGEGAERGALEQQARESGLADAVRFAGWRADVPRQLAAADVVALPSLQEGLGVAALEAMAAGRSLVASRVGGLAELVREGEDGWLVPPGDPGALARALTQALADPERRRTMGEAGRRRVAREFSMTRMTSDNETLYRRLVG